MGAEAKRSEHLERVARELRETSKADFAFVLSRKGKLLTAEAPATMPASGRERLARAAEDLPAGERVTVVTLAREELVPFGGAGLVDVYVGLAADVAIVCAVLATWTDAKPALAALVHGLDRLEELVSAQPARSKAGRKRTLAPPAMRGPTPKPRPATEPPPRPARIPDDPGRRTDAGLGRFGRASMGGVRPLGPALGPALVTGKGDLRQASFPEIHLRESTIGRETMAEVALEGRTSAPSIEVGDGALGRESLAAVERDVLGPHASDRASSSPSLEIGQATLGRESLAAVRVARASGPAIELGEARLSSASLEAVRGDAAARSRVASAPELELGEATVGRNTHDEIRADAAQSAELGNRPTHPWVEAPADAKRTFQAQRQARRVLPPRVTVKLEEIDIDGVEDEERKP